MPFRSPRDGPYLTTLANSYIKFESDVGRPFPKRPLCNASSLLGYMLSLYSQASSLSEKGCSQLKTQLSEVGRVCSELATSFSLTTLFLLARKPT